MYNISLGEVDEETLKMVGKKRCGDKDKYSTGDTGGGAKRFRRYATSGTSKYLFFSNMQTGIFIKQSLHLFVMSIWIRLLLSRFVLQL